MGNANVSIAGLSSPNQTLAFVEAASWIGDGETSGVLGLAYEITERVFTTTDRRLWYAGSSAQILYDTVFTSLWKANQTPPVFSMTVEEKGKKGFLAFGGRPPVDVKGEMARTQIRIVSWPGIHIEERCH